jgi:fluoroacetyl-CoA thioesterase
MRSIPLGARGFFGIVVTPDHLANSFKDAMLPPILATPVMIMIMENAALNAIKPYLDVGETAKSRWSRDIEGSNTRPGLH